jgi:hypothetical protein
MAGRHVPGVALKVILAKIQELQAADPAHETPVASRDNFFPGRS